jgi:hypothetical protein
MQEAQIMHTVKDDMTRKIEFGFRSNPSRFLIEDEGKDESYHEMAKEFLKLGKPL